MFLLSLLKATLPLESLLSVASPYPLRGREDKRRSFQSSTALSGRKRNSALPEVHQAKTFLPQAHSPHRALALHTLQSIPQRGTCPWENSNDLPNRDKPERQTTFLPSALRE